MSEVAGKWGAVVAQRGFSQIPNVLLTLNQFADPKLSPLELLILIELSGMWWKKDELPYPSMKTLAARCGASERQVARAIKNLEGIPLLTREKRRSKGIISTNAYDLSPLADALEEVAKAFPTKFPRKSIRRAAEAEES